MPRQVPVFVLGAADPEMERIEQTLRSRGYPHLYAGLEGPRGVQRVWPPTAYKATLLLDPETEAPVELEPGTEVVPVECDGPVFEELTVPVRVDHHRPGDPGYSAPPSNYWEASSLGQVFDLLDLRPTQTDLLYAAADHCPSNAYRGQCPGVDPEDLAEFRATRRAEWLRSLPRHKPEVLAVLPYLKKDTPAGWRRALLRVYESTSRALDRLPRREIYPGGPALVFSEEPLPELPEVLSRRGIPALYLLQDPRSRKWKVGIIGAHSEQHKRWVRLFLREARKGEVAGFAVDPESAYGDPARGYAGAFLVADLT